MGERAGGGAGFGSGARRGDTERGYSASLARSITFVENLLKGNDYESLGAFDDTGKLTYFQKGAKHYVMYDGRAVADKIVTHNHPSGGSFSHQDIEGMVSNNMKEMRITAKEFTYSMKRPKGGWGATGKNAGAMAQHFHDKALATFKQQKTGNIAADRKLWIGLSTKATKQLAKYYGWDFTVRKN